METEYVLIKKQDWDVLIPTLSESKILAPECIEISIDKTIEERAVEFLNYNCSYNSISGMYDNTEPRDLVKFATIEQNIISEINSKDKKELDDLIAHYKQRITEYRKDRGLLSVAVEADLKLKGLMIAKKIIFKESDWKRCGIGDNVCNCKEEKDCGYK